MISSDYRTIFVSFRITSSTPFQHIALFRNIFNRFCVSNDGHREIEDEVLKDFRSRAGVARLKAEDSAAPPALPRLQTRYPFRALDRAAVRRQPRTTLLTDEQSMTTQAEAGCLSRSVRKKEKPVQMASNCFAEPKRA